MKLEINLKELHNQIYILLPYRDNETIYVLVEVREVFLRLHIFCNGEKMKNIEYSKVITLKEQIEYGKGQVISKTLVQNNKQSLTLFSFDKDEEVSTHKSSGDALVIALDGSALITIDGKEYILNVGESIVMPANHPHSVKALTQLKMFLVVSF